MNIDIIHTEIYDVRGHRVMLDYDIAEMFEIQTKVLNQAVKRNIERFPDGFMFQLTEKEWETLRSQIVNANENSLISKKGASKKRNISALPYAFTKHGVTMLASVLRSEKAVKTSIAIVHAFNSMKQYVLDRSNISKQIASIKDELAERIDEQDVPIIEIDQVLDKLIEDKEKTAKREPLGFKQKQRIENQLNYKKSVIINYATTT